MKKRKHISLKVKLAAALLAIEYYEPGDGAHQGESTRAISHEHAKLMTADQIISLFEWHHYPIEHEDGGPDAPWNLTPLFKGAHKVETKKGAKARAKTRRIRKRIAGMPGTVEPGMTITYQNPAIHPARITAVYAGGKPKRKAKIPSRPFPKRRTKWPKRKTRAR